MAKGGEGGRGDVRASGREGKGVMGIIEKRYISDGEHRIGSSTGSAVLGRVYMSSR